MPRRANAADKIKGSIEVIGQIDYDFAFPQAKRVVRRFGVRNSLCHELQVRIGRSNAASLGVGRFP
jgi:hypothetical protein